MGKGSFSRPQATAGLSAGVSLLSHCPLVRQRVPGTWERWVRPGNAQGSLLSLPRVHSNICAQESLLEQCSGLNPGCVQGSLQVLCQGWGEDPSDLSETCHACFWGTGGEPHTLYNNLFRSCSDLQVRGQWCRHPAGCHPRMAPFSRGPPKSDEEEGPATHPRSHGTTHAGCLAAPFGTISVPTAAQGETTCWFPSLPISFLHL